MFTAERQKRGFILMEIMTLIIFISAPFVLLYILYKVISFIYGLIRAILKDKPEWYRGKMLCTDL